MCIERFTRSVAGGKLRRVDPASHQAPYRSLPLILGGLLGSLGVLFAGIAAALLTVLPILIGWLLRRSWRRRQSVMRAMR